MTQENRSSRQPDLEMIQVRRNPYLVDYRTGKNIVRHVGRRVGQPQDRQTGRYADQSRSNHTGGRTERSQHSISAMPQEGGRKKSHPQYSTTAQQKNKAWRQEQGHPGNAYEQNVYKDNTYSTRVRQRRVRAGRQRRRRQARIRRHRCSHIFW